MTRNRLSAILSVASVFIILTTCLMADNIIEDQNSLSIEQELNLDFIEDIEHGDDYLFDSPDGEYRSYFQLYLIGVPIIRNNSIDIYKIPSGLSIYRNNAYFHDGFKLAMDKEIDIENRTVLLKPKFATNIDLYYPVTFTFYRYIFNIFREKYNSLLSQKMQTLLEDETRDSGAGLIPDIIIDLPALPRSVRRFIGDRPSRLSLSGSQRLTISGSSTKREDRRLTEQGRGGTFSLDMRQDLNLLLRGTIGEKIFVNVRHTSATDTPFGDPSMIEIEYRGDEDEIVQSIKGGNISLALTGSEFIRYSASSTGLFGVRGDFKLGNLTITAIASKEESEKLSRRFTGTDAADSLQYRSRDFVNRTHYYVDSPYDLYDLYQEGDPGFLAGYANNAIKTTNDGSWIIANPNLLPDRNYPFRIYLDTGQISYSENTIDGWEIGEDPTAIEPYKFEILEETLDFYVDYDSGRIAMNRAIDRLNTIGIIYTRRDGVQIGDPNENQLFVKIIRRGNQNVNDTDTWPLQVRNMYNLNRRNIQNDGFRMNFFTVNPDGTLNYYVDESIVPGGYEINDYLRLDTNGDTIINGFDETVDLANGYIIIPFIEPFKSFSDNIIYEQETFSSTDWELIRIFLSVVGKVGRDRIELGQMNILPGSVRVVVDGETLQENVHYLVDYDFGNISFLTEKGRNPDSVIEINYEYRPLFAVESKTLMGMRADWKFSDIAQLGGTFIYHAERVSDRRPRIGNENRTLIMADIDGRLEFDPPILTKMVDLIPLIRTDASSRVRLSGEVAMTMPNIYGHKDQPDRKEAYLDDMETIVDTYPLGLTRLGWSPASKPVNVGSMRARPNWYNPDNIYAEQVFSPEFLTAKERREKVQVLTLRAVPPEIANPNITNQYWGGIMRYLGNEIDFSEKKYIEVLVKIDQYDFQNIEPSVTMHIDMGDISEDFYVWNGNKGILNTEDGANGGIRDGILEPREDVGLDGIPATDAQGNDVPGNDPWDRFSIERDSNGDYPFINGTAGNGILDTEDLNNNGLLDTLNRYFQYTINLNSYNYESEYNGWRLFRIPMDDFIVKTEVGSQPDLRRINFARVWLEVDQLTRVHIAKMEVIGNKWQEGFIKEIANDRVLTPMELSNNDEAMSVGVVDNQKNRDHYVSPPGVTATEDGVPLLEQSLIIDYRNLQQGHYGMTIQRFLDTQNLLSYGKMRFWLYLERERDNEVNIPKGDQQVIFRAGADSLNYYEVRYPAEAFSYYADGNKMHESNWREIEVDFSKLTSLKQYLESATDVYETAVPITVGGEPDSLYLKVRGNRVTLTNIREMAVGLANKGMQSFNGRLYVNEIRVADPFEDIGFAARTTLNTTFADFSTLNMGLVWRSENFNTSTTRTRSISNEESITFDITNRYNLHKFLPAEWGFNLPLTLMRNQSYGIPRYKANSDILRADIADPLEKEREKRESLSRSAELSFNQTTTPRSKWLQYTIRNTSLRGNIRMNQNLTSTTADTTLIYTGNLTYNLSLPKEKMGFRLGSNYSVYFFPYTFNNMVNYRSEQPRRWRWDTNLPDTLAVKWSLDRYAIDREELNLSTTINYDLTTDLKSVLGFTQKRDLTREYRLWDVIPFGKESERDQNITLNYTPNYFQSIFSFNASGSVRYNDRQRPIQQSLPGFPTDEDYIYEYEGNLTRNFRGNLTLKNRDLLNGLMSKYGIRYRELPTTTDYYYDDSTFPSDSMDGLDDKGFFEPEKSDFQRPGGFEDPFRGDFGSTEDARQAEEKKRQEELGRQEELKRQEEMRRGEPDDKKLPPAVKTEEAVQEQRLWARVLTYIARIDNINLTYDNSYGSRYSRRETRPSFLYQLGFPNQFEDESEELDMKNNRDTFTAASGYPILTNLTTTWNYSYTVDRRYSTASQKEITTVFPNVRVTLTGFERIIRAERFLTSSRLTSNYTYTERVRGAIDWDKPHWDTPTAKSQTFSFSPLLSWQANWIANITSTVAYNFSEAKTITYRETFDAVQTTRNTVLNANLAHSFRSPQGIKLPFFSQRMPITNELTSELGGSWERSKSSNKGIQDTIVDRDTEKYTITPRMTYNFSRNIKGGLQSSYENTHDKRRDEKLKIFTLSIWAEVLF